MKGNHIATPVDLLGAVDEGQSAREHLEVLLTAEGEVGGRLGHAPRLEPAVLTRDPEVGCRQQAHERQQHVQPHPIG